MKLNRQTNLKPRLLHPQVLGSDQRRLHPLEDEQSGLHDDIPGVVLRSHRLVGAPVWLEGSRVLATDPGPEVHGFAGCGLSGMLLLLQLPVLRLIVLVNSEVGLSITLLSPSCSRPINSTGFRNLLHLLRSSVRYFSAVLENLPNCPQAHSSETERQAKGGQCESGEETE